MLTLKFEEDDDGSGCGTLILSKDGFDFMFVPVSHTGQLEIMDELVGDYSKLERHGLKEK